MSKIKIEVILKENNKEIININQNAIYLNNTIKYISDDTINILDIENLLLKRKTKEYEMIINFKNNNIKYKYNNYELEIKIEKIKIISNQNELIIEYEIPETKCKYNYKIKWNIV